MNDLEMKPCPRQQVHRLKTWPEYFSEVRSNDKKFEIRKNDRDYQTGDILILEEFNPTTGQYTGELEHRRVTYICYGGSWGIPNDSCVMAVEPLVSPTAGIVEELRKLKALLTTCHSFVERIHSYDTVRNHLPATYIWAGELKQQLEHPLPETKGVKE